MIARTGPTQIGTDRRTAGRTIATSCQSNYCRVPQASTPTVPISQDNSGRAWRIRTGCGTSIQSGRMLTRWWPASLWT